MNKPNKFEPMAPASTDSNVNDFFQKSENCGLSPSLQTGLKGNCYTLGPLFEKPPWWDRYEAGLMTAEELKEATAGWMPREIHSGRESSSLERRQ